VRVVSLTCSNTEIVSALGCAEHLVGVDDHSDYPEALCQIVQSIERLSASSI
jgi:iron complex transport system substrate-binding protein